MPRFSQLAAALALCAASLGGLTAQAADEPRYNQVAVRAEVSQEVAHDLMHVTLYSEAQNTDPAKLADEITRTLNTAVDKARKTKGVTLSLGSRNSYPVYDEKGQKITAWRERAELRLESADFATLSQLSADLMGQLKMAGMNFSIAEKTRKTHEDDLIKQAVDAFKARAQLATDALGGKGYKLVNLSLNSAGFQPPQPIMMRAMAAKGYAADSAVPEIEAGTSRVNVTADGTIEVQMP
ncbi:SIMPL domain-containing protein [Metapseudomonas furukawaii]|uniref:SIMPL domain-containing protein n=1 Tax=Metapseudomonas furukawaii TaxID=1149133 RepID=UPI00227D11A1|nr:SIMPL domain-containing protein [Pseudomonas furukawaii]WAG79998.1 SIMPL domain-containing protein [Pseudomonas furukawaii]